MHSQVVVGHRFEKVGELLRYVLPDLTGHRPFLAEFARRLAVVVLHVVLVISNRFPPFRQRRGLGVGILVGGRVVLLRDTLDGIVDDGEMFEEN